MIEAIGQVVAIDGAYAEVQTERHRSVCGGCSANGACGTSLLERFFGAHPPRVRALNRAAAQVGDRVVLGVSEQGLLAASAAVYLVPILALVGGAALGESLLPTDIGDLGALIGGVLGLGTALAWLRAYGAGAARRPEQQAVVIRQATRSVEVDLPSRP